MNKEFIPYEQALELKELGFDEPCMAAYVLGQFYFKGDNYIYGSKDIPNINAPTFSQVFRWFRDKYNIDAWVQPFVSELSDGDSYLPDETYSYFIFRDGIWKDDRADFLDPESAELACINKLIEISKNK